MKIKTSVEVDGSLNLSQIANATLDTDKFLVSDGGAVKYRTGVQLLSDIGSGVFVPYTGATGNVNLGEYGLSTGNIQFDTTPTVPPTTVGSLAWNDTDGTLNLSLKGESVTLQIGQETVARVVNKTATNITLLEANYQAVRVTGAQGQRPKVDLAQADNDLDSAATLGLVTETILINQEGFITTSGQVREINTTGSLQGETWLDGDILYLSGTVAGRITNIKPIAPIHTVIIGFVEYAHAIHGKIFVKVNNGYELEELHNVSAVSPNNNEVLVYDTSALLWTPKTVPTILGYAPADDTNVVHKTGDENIIGTKTFNQVGSGINIKSYIVSGGVGMYLQNDSSGINISSNNESNGYGIRSGNYGNYSEAIGIYSTNYSIGTGNYFYNFGTGRNLVLENHFESTGLPFTVSKNGFDKLTISDTGYINSASGAIFASSISASNLSGTNTGDQTLTGLGGVPTSRTLTINGVTQDLSANRTFTVAGSMSIGGLITSATSGSVLFAGIGGVLQQDNSQFFWDDTNNRLGLGTTIPAEKLDVSGNIKMSGGGGRTLTIEATGAGGTEIKLLPNTTAGFARINVGNTNQPLDFQMNSANVMRITQAGFIGIGTTVPVNKLHISSDVNVITGANAQFAVGGSANINKKITIGYDTTSDYGFIQPLIAGTSYSNLIINPSGGNVGIGTTSPSRLLSLGGTAYIGMVFKSTSASGVSGGGALYFGNSSTDSSGILNYDHSGNFMNFFTAGSEKMRITSGGNIGIGTASPNFKQHTVVAGSTGDLAGFGLSGNTNNPLLLIKADAINQVITFRGGSSSGVYPSIAFDTGTGGERMRITSSGNVGIGTTTPNNNTNRTSLTLNNSAWGGQLDINVGGVNHAQFGTDNFNSGLSCRIQSIDGIVFNVGGANEKFRIASTGAATFSSLGTGLVYSNAGTLTSTNPSDERLKEEITDLSYGLSEILQLRPVTYNWKNDTIEQGKQFGFIAQEVQKVMPDLIKEFETKDGEEDVIRLGLDKEGIFVTLINAIKEQQTQIDILKAEIELLKIK